MTVGAGDYHSLGLKADGSIVAWGNNEYGQCDVPAPNADFVALAAGWYHSLGLKADGSIIAWGANQGGQCDVPAPNTDFVVVAGGAWHSLGLKADGSIVTWGCGIYDNGQCEVPTPNADFVALAAGAFHNLAIKNAPRLPADLDIKPGVCPNSFDRMSHGVLPAAVLGRREFDVKQIDLGTVRLVRGDRVGRSVAPRERQIDPHSMYQDVATPVAGKPCDCHLAKPDGFVDLCLTFNTDDVVANFLLDDLDVGTSVELAVIGSLRDGTRFEATDCILLVPPGTQAGVVAVRSNVPGVWIDADPLDLQLDGGGFADFERTYPAGSVVTLAAESGHQGKRFVGWRLDGQFQSTEQRIDLMVTADRHTVEAILLHPGDMNGDEHVNLRDFGTFDLCFGDRADDPAKCPAESRAASDLDGDGDVDLRDFATFASNFTG